ncbi:MAG: nucleotidyltransferase domain-containing protein [Dysgonamonadaceae bacterium]|jgi:predicted nucleotidyltransferase|nr:nucleotidyltransferase domain-containing protein [Dysgonamonadaceae bacterium]
MSNVSFFQQQLRNNDVFSRFNIDKIGIFGSYARDEENAEDIDILLDEDVKPEKMIELRQVLERLFNKKIDLVIKKFANPIILYRAQKDLRYATPY